MVESIDCFRDGLRYSRKFTPSNPPRGINEDFYQGLLNVYYLSVENHQAQVRLSQKFSWELPGKFHIKWPFGNTMQMYPVLKLLFFFFPCLSIGAPEKRPVHSLVFYFKGKWEQIESKSAHSGLTSVFLGHWSCRFAVKSRVLLFWFTLRETWTWWDGGGCNYKSCKKC